MRTDNYIKLLREGPVVLDDHKQPEVPKSKDMWQMFKERGERIEYVESGKPISLTGGGHYFELIDNKNRIVKCTSCPVSHGGILEAHLLTRYEVRGGVIYLDGVAKTTLPVDNTQNSDIQSSS